MIGPDRRRVRRAGSFRAVLLGTEGPWVGAVASTASTSLILIGAGIAVRTIAKRAATGQLDRNGLGGIRTRATMASDQAWEAAHKAGWAPTQRGAFVLMATGVLSIMPAPILALLGSWTATRYMTLWTVVLCLGMAIALTLIVIGANLGNRAAQAVAARSAD